MQTANIELSTELFEHPARFCKREIKKSGLSPIKKDTENRLSLGIKTDHVLTPN